MSIFDQMVAKIIKEQELIIGPLALSEAQKVTGIHVLDPRSGEVSISNGDNKQIIDKLVARYERLFGRASKEVCRNAAAPFLMGLNPSEIPLSLK